MEPIELYDIITLDNDEEYTVIKKINQNNKNYYLLAPVDEEEEPDFENIKIIEEIIENNKIIVEDVEDENLLKELSNSFLESLRKGIE